MIRPNPVAARLAPYVPPQGRSERDLLLDFNENTAGPCPAALRAVRSLAPAALSLYPELGPWRKRFARRLRLREGRLFLCAGTDEAIAALIGAYGRGEVLYPVPTFGMYRFYAERGGLRPREVRPGEDLAGAVGPRTSLVFLASPNNPTGTVLPRTTLLAVLRKARHALVAMDEAYIEFGGQSALPLLGRFPNLVVLRTFSKAYGLAGLRVGFLAGDPRVISVLERSASPYRVSTASLTAAEAALAAGASDHARGIRRERERLRRSLLARGLAVPPSKANFLLIPLGKAAPRILKGLTRRGIRLRDRSADPGLDGTLRVTVGTPGQMRRFLKAFDEVTR